MGSNPQTLEEVLLKISGDWQIIVLVMAAVTLVSLVLCYLLKRSSRSTLAHRYMSVPIFVTTIPGVFFCLILAYLLFFTQKDLLTVPLFYFFPPVWMGISLFLYAKFVDFKKVPGFHRLSGLVLFSVLTFAAILLIFKFRVLAIVWFDPLWAVVIVFVFYLVWKFSLDRLLKRK